MRAHVHFILLLSIYLLAAPELFYTQKHTKLKKAIQSSAAA